MTLCNRVARFLRRARNLWTVEVRWGGKTFTHYARNAADVFEWAGCYPLDATVRVLDFQKPYAVRLGHRDGVWVAL